jgi:hypothetical protein
VIGAYLTGITVAVVLTVLLEVLLSEGETKKFVKGMVSLLILAAIIVPLPALIKGTDLTTAFTTADAKVNGDYLARINAVRGEELKNAVTNKLEVSECTNVSVNVYFVDYSATVPEIAFVAVTCNSPKLEYSEVKTAIKTAAKVTDEKIILTLI